MSQPRNPVPLFWLMVTACSGGSTDGSQAAPPTQLTGKAREPDAGRPTVFFGVDAGVGDDDAGFELASMGQRGPDTPAAAPGVPKGHVQDAGTETQDVGERESDGLEGLVRFELRFQARVGERMVGCDERFPGVGDPPTSVSFRDLRFYVHDVMLIRKDGTGVEATLARDGSFHNGAVAMLDFEDGTGDCEGGDPETSHVVRAGAKEGTYVGVAFQIGVPEDLNHADPTLAQPPLDVLGMHWGWNDGYKHLRVDATTEAGATFNVHLGSTRCAFDEASGGPVCARANRPQIVFAAFDPSTHRIVFDYGALLAGINLGEVTTGCIAGGTPEACKPLLGALGVDQPSGMANPESQSVFRVEQR